MSYVSWAYQHYLGRYPESQDAKTWHESQSGGRFDSMRHSLINSPEYLNTGLFDTPIPRSGTFFFPQDDAPKICILGNCQGPEIAKAMVAIAAEPISVCGLEIMDLAQSRDEMIGLVQSADHVVACKVYNPEYRDIAPETIRGEYRKDTLEFSPLHFTGLHPDLIVLGSYGRRVLSPIGDYNSRIIISAFIAGLSKEETVAAFTRETYEKANYFQEFEWSRNTMVEREKALDDRGIRIGDWFLDEIKKEPILYTVNHPKPKVFAAFAEKILENIGISRRPVQPDNLPDKLSSDVIWPVEPSIAAANNVQYDTAPIYWRRGVALSREEFVWRSFKAYESLGAEFLRDSIGQGLIVF